MHDSEAGIPAGLLSPDNLAAYLSSRGLSPGRVGACRSLGGGVSNVVLAVEVGERSLVVKQSLPRLRVHEEWTAKRERVLTEARALRLQAELTPGRVPEVLDVDPDRFVITIAHAPTGWSDWKGRLLTGDADPEVAAELGRVVGVWHRATDHEAQVARDFADWEAFEQLRVDPYYRTLSRRCPEVAPPVLSRIASMEASRRCLVHGDFSPKNVLLRGSPPAFPPREDDLVLLRGSPPAFPPREDDLPTDYGSLPLAGLRPGVTPPSHLPGLWVVDAEVAHFGDPAFDTGFMLNHLMLKAIHRPSATASYRACARLFWAAYKREGGVAGSAETLGHLACLMLSRVHGKSPAEYLDERGRRRADRLGHRLLLSPPENLGRAWDVLEEVAG